MNKAGAIIQARMGASRLPGKVMIEILGKPVLGYVIERVKRAKSLGDVVVATTVNEADLEIALAAERLGAKVFRGSEDDVLDRYYCAAKEYGMKDIVRITADCPLIDPKVIDGAVEHYFNAKSDYCSNSVERTFPNGEDVEVFNFGALERARKEARLISEREHVTPYIWKNPGMFRLTAFKNKEDLSEKRWTVDREEDLRFIRIVLEALYPVNPYFHMEDVLDFLRRNPHLEDINKGIHHREGYLKSLREDKIVK